MKYFLVFVVSNLKNILGKSAKIVLDGSPRQLDILQSMPGKNPFVFSDRNLAADRDQMRSCSMQAGWNSLYRQIFIWLRLRYNFVSSVFSDLQQL